MLKGILSEKSFSEEDAEALVNANWVANLLTAFTKDVLSLSQMAQSSLFLVPYLLLFYYFCTFPFRLFLFIFHFSFQNTLLYFFHSHFPIVSLLFLNRLPHLSSVQKMVFTFFAIQMSLKDFALSSVLMVPSHFPRLLFFPSSPSHSLFFISITFLSFSSFSLIRSNTGRANESDGVCV